MSHDCERGMMLQHQSSIATSLRRIPLGRVALLPLDRLHQLGCAGLCYVFANGQTSASGN